MNTFLKIFFILYILSLITSSSIDLRPVDKQNIFEKFNLNEFDNSTQIGFQIPNPTSNYMVVELALSHPSKFDTAFEYIQENKEDPTNLNLFEEKNSKRLLLEELSEDNSVDIEKEESVFGKNKYIIKLEENMNYISLSVTPKENAELKGNEIIVVKYKITEQKEEKEKYSLKDKTIKVNQKQDMLNISFVGVQTEDKNVSVDYSIKLFDKSELESKYENIYMYDFCTEINPLFSKNIKIKGVISSQDIYLVIKATLNDKKDQLLLVNARPKNKDEEENVLQYEVYNFKVEEQSPKRVWPDDKKEDSDSRKENRPILILILGCFFGSVILTFILVLIYTKLINKQKDIEEDKDYKDVGGIVDEEKTPKDGKKINEEEE